VRSWFGECNNQTDQRGNTYMMSLCHGEVWKAEERSKRGWDVSSLLKCDDDTFRVNNDKLTMHQSTVLWFECVKGGKEKRMSTSSIKKGPVEAEIWLTFSMVGRWRPCDTKSVKIWRRERREVGRKFVVVVNLRTRTVYLDLLL
jgi:hypothetical protein